MFSGDQPISANIYRARCDKIAPKSAINLIFALSKPNGNDSESRWILLSAKYEAGGHKREKLIRECFVTSCNDEMPKSFDEPTLRTPSTATPQSSPK